MSLREGIISILTKELTPIYLEVKDFSESHRGHSGYREGGETHFDVVIISDVFSGKSRIDRQKLVYHLLDHEIKTKIHALTLKTLTGEEAKKRNEF
jgi:BolA family transcriptional regulator, general stress-responsive regulator